MPTRPPFSRSDRALEADRFRRPFAPVIAAALGLVGVSAWFVLGRVPRFEVSATARVESRVHPATATRAGRIARAHLTLGREVTAGELLVVVDARADELLLAQGRAQARALGERVDALRRQVAADSRAIGASDEAARAAIREARARIGVVAPGARIAAERADRMRRLSKTAAARAALDLARAEAEAATKRAGAQGAKAALGRLQAVERVRAADRSARRHRSELLLRRVEGELATARARNATLMQTIEEHRIRAPVAGRLAQVQRVRVGGYLARGARVATVVARGALRGRAHFAPTSAASRIRPGQRARLRLHGFPWTQYGLLDATVAGVGAEVDEKGVEVALVIDAAPGLRVPLQHGLPATAEVEVARVSPLALLLRAAGRRSTTLGPVARSNKASRAR